MQKVIGVTELQRRFRRIFDEVAQRKSSYVLTRGSRPEAVLISYEDFLRYQVMDEKESLARFDAVWERLNRQNAGINQIEIDNDVKTARQAKYK